MSAKKKDKNEWSYCEKCLCLFPRLHISNHVKRCEEQTEFLSSEIEGGFIKNNIFNGICKSYCELTDGKLPNSRPDYVIVHPITLKNCNLSVASTVKILYGTNDTFGTLWPSKSVALDCISLMPTKLQSLKTKEGQKLSIHKVIKPSIVTDTIQVEIISHAEYINNYLLNDVILTLSSILDNTLITKGEIISCFNHGKKLLFMIKEIICESNGDEELTKQLSQLQIAKNEKECSNLSPSMFMMNHTTLNITLPQVVTEQAAPYTPSVNYENIGGLQHQIDSLDNLIKTPFSNHHIYSKSGVAIPKGMIVHGPSGTGKTTLVHSYLSALESIHMSVINGPELTSKYFGETEQKLREIFNLAISKAPSVLIIDEFDTVCPKRTSSSNESEKRVVATFCTLMDSIPTNTLFVVIGLTNNLEGLDPALRRPGRFEKEVEFGVPNCNERFDILLKLMTNFQHDLKESDINELSSVTHGYVGADLSALCKEAGGIAVREFIQSNKSGCLDMLVVSIPHFKQAMCIISPSALKAMTVDVPKVYWNDVGGQKEVKQKLREAIEWPLQHPDAFVRLGIKPPRGLLMYGPPGCSKTMMAKALATESSLNFISIKGPELFNKYLGESERAVREVFRKARMSAPSIIFFDEIDALGVQRSGKEKGSGSAGDRVLAQLLTELDGVESLDGVIVVAATNRPDIIDPALIRPGRIDRLIYVPLPDSYSRKEIFEIMFRSMPIEDVLIESLVELTEGYSGAEICSICHEAGMFALREDINSVSVKNIHFEAAINQVKPGTSKEILEYYNSFAMKQNVK